MASMWALLKLATALVSLMSADATNQCLQTCARATMKVSYGFDPAFRPLDIDIGTCTAAESRTDCGSEGYLTENDTYSLVSESCDQTCVPNDYDLKPYSNRTDLFMAAVVKSCRPSNPTCGNCQLAPLWITVFPGSPYKSDIDVGVCEGTCPESRKACVVTKKKNAAVSGPNGAVTVEQTMECGCQNSTCYREDYYESYWEVVQGTNVTNETVTIVREKLINVGRCGGGCNGIFTPKICLPTPEMCVIRVGGGKTSCNPATSEVHEFEGPEGQHMSVAAVKSCRCN